MFIGTLKATVTPNTATGTVQFKRNGTVIDTERVTNGSAVDGLELNLVLVAGANYTAVFTPDNPAAYGPSTLNTLQLP